METYELHAFASAENTVFTEYVDITVDAENIEKAKELAMRELERRLLEFGFDVELDYKSHEVIVSGDKFEDVWYGFDED